MIDRKLMLSHLSSLSEKAKKEPGYRSIIKENNTRPPNVSPDDIMFGDGTPGSGAPPRSTPKPPPPPPKPSTPSVSTPSRPPTSSPSKTPTPRLPSSIGTNIASGLASVAGGIGGGLLGGAVGGPIGTMMGSMIGAGLAQGGANKAMRVPPPPRPEDPTRPFGKGPKITGGIEVGGVPTGKGLWNTAKEVLSPKGMVNPTNLVGMGLGIPLQYGAELAQSKALDAVGIKDPDTQWYLSQPGSWAAGAIPAGALSGGIATGTMAGAGAGALGGAAAGGAAGIGAAAGWGAARGLIHASDALGITDNMADKPTNPFSDDYVPIWSSKPAPITDEDSEADQGKISMKDWEDQQAIEDKQLEARKNSDVARNRKEQMRRIMAGLPPDPNLNTKYPDNGVYFPSSDDK